MRGKTNIAVVIVIAIAACVGCTRQELTPEKVQSMIDRELRPGATSSQIEDFFYRHHLKISYDDLSGARYVSIIRYDKFSGVTIDIYTDKRRRFVRADARGYTTGL